MNDLNKILGIYDAKVNVNCVKDILGWKVYFHNPYAKVAFSLTHISTFTIVAFSSTIRIRQLPER